MIRIAHITDTHIEHQSSNENGVDSRQNWELLLADVKKRNVDFIVIGGDIGSDEILPYFFESLTSLGIPFHIGLGNQDKLELLAPYLEQNKSENQNEWYYSFQDAEQNQYYLLDSSIGTISLTQQNWFLNQLKATTKKSFVFVHHPFLDVNTRVDIDFPLLKRNKLIKKINKIPVEINLFAGHYHTENFKSVNNINQYVTPSAAFEILKDTDTIEINPNRFGYRLIVISNGIIDNELKMYDAI